MEQECARAPYGYGITIGAIYEADGAGCKGGFAGDVRTVTEIFGVVIRHSCSHNKCGWLGSFPPTFLPYGFPFPRTPLLFAFLALAFPICLNKQEIERDRQIENSPRNSRCHCHCCRSAFSLSRWIRGDALALLTRLHRSSSRMGSSVR
jgi:hypothetical protein